MAAVDGIMVNAGLPCRFFEDFSIEAVFTIPSSLPVSKKVIDLMLTTHAVGIDLGTTYSSIAYLNEHGEPVSIPNQEGELSTPSVVFFDGDEVVVGTEALRNAIMAPGHVIQNSKRFIGDLNHHWTIDGKPYSPVEVATFILKKLISAAQEKIGPIEQAVITVPAQFSDLQRHATIEAGHRAGLQRVDIINEPVAAALCYVLGTEGLWFTELAEEQRILVYDLGGGTFDLSLVRYRQNEVSVIASNGDLHLGGIDWNHSLREAIAEQFTSEFQADPRYDAESLQFLSLEVEQAKRSLSVRPKTALICQHGGKRKTYQVQQEQFEKLTKPLVDKTVGITQQMLKNNKMGWAHVDVVLTIGGASRMPMIRNCLKGMSGRTLNTSLSPDLSIAHGAGYYAGMLLTNDKFAKSILSETASERLRQVRQQSVNARELGIMIRDPKTNTRIPHYLIPANSPLPAACTHHFGTVVPNQRRVHLQIVESGTSPEKPIVKLGECIVDDLPPNLPVESEIAVTIQYDEQAQVHVSAKEIVSGKEASTKIIRQENLVPQLATDQDRETEATILSTRRADKTPVVAQPQPVSRSRSKPRKISKKQVSEQPRPQTKTRKKRSSEAAGAAPAPKDVIHDPFLNEISLEDADRPVPLCNECGNVLDSRRKCRKCGEVSRPPQGAKKQRKKAQAGSRRVQSTRTTQGIDDDQVLELLGEPSPPENTQKRQQHSEQTRSRQAPAKSSNQTEAGEEEFWDLKG